MAVRLMGTVFCTAFATVTGTARFGAVSADLVAQAESQSSTMGRTIVRTAVRDLFCRRIISYFERCEELQVFAHASGMADLVRGQFPDLNSIYFTACDHVRPNFCARGGRKFRGGSTRTFFVHLCKGLDAARGGRLQENFRAWSPGGGLVEEPKDAPIGGADAAGRVCAGARIRFGAES